VDDLETFLETFLGTYLGGRRNAGRGGAWARARRRALPRALGEVQALGLTDDRGRGHLAVDTRGPVARLEGLGRVRRRRAAQAARAAVPGAAPGESAPAAPVRRVDLHALRGWGKSVGLVGLVGTWTSRVRTSRPCRSPVPREALLDCLRLSPLTLRANRTSDDQAAAR
jgi:hypothetical protein